MSISASQRIVNLPSDSDTCWFCRSARAYDNCAVVVDLLPYASLEEAVRGNPRGEVQTVRVRRCPKCKKGHILVHAAVLAASIGGWLLTFGVAWVVIELFPRSPEADTLRGLILLALIVASSMGVGFLCGFLAKRAAERILLLRQGSRRKNDVLQAAPFKIYASEGWTVSLKTWL